MFVCKITIIIFKRNAAYILKWVLLGMTPTLYGDFSKLKDMLHTQSSYNVKSELSLRVHFLATLLLRNNSGQYCYYSGKAFSYRNGMLNLFYNIINHGQTFLPDKSHEIKESVARLNGKDYWPMSSLGWDKVEIQSFLSWISPPLIFLWSQ